MSPEEEEFFIGLLGDQMKPERFDFRDPALKRREFNMLSKNTLKEFQKKGRTKCELNLVSNCRNQNLVLDHIIPLSSNELNKRLLHIKAELGHKVKQQSFGSNHESNFLVACPACNGFKKHRFIKRVNGKWQIVIFPKA